MHKILINKHNFCLIQKPPKFTQEFYTNDYKYLGRIFFFLILSQAKSIQIGIGAFTRELSLLPKDIGRPAEISSKPPTSLGSLRKSPPSRRRSREVSRNLFRVADSVGSSAEISSEPPTVSGGLRRFAPSCRRPWEVCGDLRQTADVLGRSAEIPSIFFRKMFGD